MSDRAHPSNADRASAADGRAVDTIRCAACDTEIVAATAGRFKKRYCSPRCRARAYYRAHRAALADRQRKRRAGRRGELAVDPVPLSPREAAMMAASAEEIARGEYVTSDALRARLGLRPAR